MKNKMKFHFFYKSLNDYNLTELTLLQKHSEESLILQLQSSLVFNLRVQPTLLHLALH